MALPKYSEWKESDMSWLGDIPSHWEVKALRFIGDPIIGLTYSPSDICNADQGVLVLRSTNIQDGKIVDKNNVYVKTDVSEKLTTQLNDILICSRNGSRELIGKCGKVGEDFVGVSFGAFTTVFRSPINDFIYYVLNSKLFEYQSGSFLTTTINQLTVGAFNSFKIPLPPIDEQTQIAKFLDYKTAQIDRLIEKKKALIEKLNEQRIAMITQAVTKGLNPDAPMKDSEVDWLGEVPEHWGITKFRYLFSFGRGLGITKSDLKDEGIPCLNYGEIHSKYGFEVIPEEHPLKCVPEAYLQEGQASLLKSGDFVFADTSEDIEGSGNFSYLNSDTPTFAGYHTVIARLESNDIPRFLAYQLDSIMYRYQIRKAVTGVKVFSITQQILKSCYVWLPPIKEQLDIVDYLDGQLGAIDKMLQVNNKTIDKLNEYRTSLITAAVTGKIDVREVNVPEGV